MRTINTNEFFPKNINIAKAIAVTDSDLNFISIGENFRRFLGLQGKYHCLYNLISQEDVEPLKASVNNITEKGINFVTEMNRIDGQTRRVLLNISLIKNTGNDRKFNIVMLDLGNIHDYIYNVEVQTLKYKRLLESFGRLFFEYNSDTKDLILFKLSSVAEEVIYKNNLDNLIDNIPNANATEKDKENFLLFCHSLKNKDICFEYSFSSNPFETSIGKDGNTTIVAGRSININEEYPFTVGCVNVYTKNQPQLEYISNINSIDMMTGLLNKKAVLDIARNSVAEKKYNQLYFVMIDLDNFKLVNDNYGHILGDDVIRTISSILKKDLERHGCVGRFGGDEFFAVLHDLGEEGDLRVVLSTVANDIENSYKDKFDGFNITASIGVSEYPRNGNNFELLFKKADRAVYIAKKKGKKRYIIYKEHLHGDIDPGNNNNIYEESLDTNKFAGDIKCFSIVRDGISRLISQGSDYIDEFMGEIVSAYHLTGISVYTGEDFTLFKQWGKYSKPMQNADYMKRKSTLMCFNEKNVFRENNVQANNCLVPYIHNKLFSHNIYSTVQCLIGSHQNVRGIVTFDVENVLRSWTEDDTNYFGIISQLIGAVLNIL